MGVHTGPGSSRKGTGDKCVAEGRPRGELGRFEMTQRGAATALLGFKNTQVGVGTPADPGGPLPALFYHQQTRSVRSLPTSVGRNGKTKVRLSKLTVCSGVRSSLSLFQTILPGRQNKVNRNRPTFIYSFTMLRTVGRFLFTLFYLYVNIYSIMSNFQMPPF